MRRLSIGSPQYSRNNFGPIKEILEKNRKSGIVLWSNSIKSTWNKCFFSSFPQKGCILIVSLRRLSIGEKAFNRCPPVLQKQFWTYKRDIGKNRKSGIVLWSNSIKSTWNKCFFSSFPQKGCILIVSLGRLSIGAPPPVLQKEFWTYKRDNGKKSKIRDCFMVKFNQTNMKYYVSFLRFHKKDAYW